jgi:hypothetical protein
VGWVSDAGQTRQVSQTADLPMNDNYFLSSSANLARPAWNKGKLTGAKPLLRPGHDHACTASSGSDSFVAPDCVLW